MSLQSCDSIPVRNCSCSSSQGGVAFCVCLSVCQQSTQQWKEQNQGILTHISAVSFPKSPHSLILFTLTGRLGSVLFFSVWCLPWQWLGNSGKCRDTRWAPRALLLPGVWFYRSGQFHSTQLWAPGALGGFALPLMLLFAGFVCFKHSKCSRRGTAATGADLSAQNDAALPDNSLLLTWK